MKINPLSVRAIQSYNQTPAVKKEENKGVSFADTLEISTKAKEMQVSSSYQTARADKVSQLKEAVEAGAYEVDARKLAENMLTYYRK